MNTQNITSKLIDYREGNLTTEQFSEVKQQLENSAQWRDILKELQTLDDLMLKVPLVKPSASSQLRFDQLLEQEKRARPIIGINKNRTIKLSQIIQMAAAFALLIMGVGIGNQWKNNQVQQTEIASLKAEMLAQKKLLALSLLEQNSASSRIKGVNISLRETKMDGQILDALINRMNIDKNINVRLKAIEGLAEIGHKKKVITALIKTLNNQKSPEIQIAIIEVLVTLKAKDAYPQFQQILRNEETMDAVKNKAASGLELLLQEITY